VYVFAFGLSFAPLDWLTLRAGYNYASSPTDEEYMGPGSSAFVSHHLTGGASVAIVDGFGASVAVVYALPDEITVEKHATTPEYSNASIGADQLFIYLGFSLEL